MINRKAMLTQAIENGFDQTSEGYPNTLKYCKKKNAYDYTVYGNTVTGKNMLKATDFYTALQKDVESRGRDLPYSELEEDERNCIRFVDCWNAKYQGLTFKENTQYTVSMDCKTVSKNTSNTSGSSLFVFFYTDGTYSSIGLAKNQSWIHRTLSSTAGKTVSAIGLRSVNWTNWCYVDIDTFQFEEGATATDYEPYQGSYLGDKTKNLLPYPYSQSTKTTNGVTFTDNGDGTILINGTATANAIYYIKYTNYPIILEKGKQYTLSGGKAPNIILCLQDITYKQSVWNGKFTAEYEKYYAFIRVTEGVTVDNFVLKPQLELGETATEYEPYGYKIPLKVSGKNLLPTTVTIYRSDQLKSGESINYKTDNLPALPLDNETNVITADTEISPSNISVTYNTKVKGV